LWLVVSTVCSAALGVVLALHIDGPAAPLLGLMSGVLAAAACWGLYGLSLWVVAGLGAIAPVAWRPLAATLLSLVGVSFALLVAAAAVDVTEDRKPPEPTTHQFSLEEMDALLAKETQAKIDRILQTYPSGAEDLERDLGSRPRSFGSDDNSRRTPESADEYLVDCAKRFVRRKCAAEVVDVQERRRLWH